MNLGIESQLFLVTGATSGLGRAVAERLALEKGQVLAVARREVLLEDLKARFPGQVTTLSGDLREERIQEKISDHCQKYGLHGMFINAGGPPAKKIAELKIQDWDEAYNLLVRWKINLVSHLLPVMQHQSYGRIVFSESSSVKQPVENLVLSNSMRMAVAGFSKSLAGEYAAGGITSNLVAPGYHDTEAVDRLFKKKSELENISFEEAREKTAGTIPAGKMGNPKDFASLVAWLLSPLSAFVTGQVYALDGGNIRSSL